MHRHEFNAAIHAGQCSVAARKLDAIKHEVSKRADHMTTLQRHGAFRDLLTRQAKVDRCEGAESSRFNGLLGLGILGIL